MPNAEDAFLHTRYEDDQGVRINPCIELVVCTAAHLHDGPHPGLLNFYDAFRHRFGAQMRWYRTNTDDHFKKLKPAKLDMVPFWFNDERNKQESLLGVAFKPGNQPDDMQLPSFKFFCDQSNAYPGGVFHMALPLQAGFETLEGMLPLVHEALAEFPLLSGYVGYTVYWDTLDFRFERDFFDQNMPRLYMRHPGLGIADPLDLYRRAMHGLMGVSWLTLLGPAALAQVGGLDTLRQRLIDPITVEPLACQGGGALIVAGPRPLVGDLTEGNDLPLYKAVGHAVRDARFKARPFYGGGMSNEASVRWFHRFFGEETQDNQGDQST